jgi:hypothetical protein
MFQEFSNINTVTRELHPMYMTQIGATGPVIGTLEIDAIIHNVDSPPAPSPVGAHLVGLRFKTWKDVSKHIKKIKRKATQAMGPSVFSEWSRRIEELCKDKHRMLAYTVPLFLENQMTSISPHPGQDVLLNLIAPLIESDASIRVDQPRTEFEGASPNAFISVVLHAGRVPFTLTCHGRKTLVQWHDQLEAATVLLLPRIVIEAELNLAGEAKSIMRNALKDEMKVWRATRPRMGEMREWSWLPKLI